MPQGQSGVSLRGTFASAASIALAATVTFATGCGDDEDATDSPNESSSTSGSTSTTLSPEAEVEAAYLAYAEMGERLLQAPNPDDPEIAQRTSGEARTDLEDGLTTLRSAGHRYELGPQYGHDVLNVQLDGDRALLDVCVVDDVRLLDAVTGEVRGTGTSTALSAVDLVRDGSAWLVERVVEENVADGAGTCNHGSS